MKSLRHGVSELMSQLVDGIHGRASEVLSKTVTLKEDLIKHKIKDAVDIVILKILSEMSPEDRSCVQQETLDKLSKAGERSYLRIQRLKEFPKGVTFEVDGMAIRIKAEDSGIAKALHYGSEHLPTLNLFHLIAKWWQEETAKEGIEVTVSSSPEMRVSIAGDISYEQAK